MLGALGAVLLPLDVDQSPDHADLAPLGQVLGTAIGFLAERGDVDERRRLVAAVVDGPRRRSQTLRPSGSEHSPRRQR